MSPFPLVPRKNTTNEIVVHVPSEDEMKMLSEMFPSVESEAIKSVIEANDGNMERSINSLLSISVSEPPLSVVEESEDDNEKL